MNDRLIEAARLIIEARGQVVAVTGAGISAESGIPTFRDAKGLWAKYPPEEYATIEAYFANPVKVWKFWTELANSFKAIQPNPGHRALAELESRGCLQAIVTQNIDNLHQAAGSRHVIEYHGNARWLACPDCQSRIPLNIEEPGNAPPYCSCGSLMKPDIVMFGELIPSIAMQEAAHLAETCQVMLVIGTSAQVYPAAGLPFIANQHHAAVIEINTQPTEFTSTITNVFLQGKAGGILPKLIHLLQAR